MLARILVSMGGTVAEELVFGRDQVNDCSSRPELHLGPLLVGMPSARACKDVSVCLVSLSLVIFRGSGASVLSPPCIKVETGLNETLLEVML